VQARFGALDVLSFQSFRVLRASSRVDGSGKNLDDRRLRICNLVILPEVGISLLSLHFRFCSIVSHPYIIMSKVDIRTFHAPIGSPYTP
jgi:hypothetical protein